MMTPTTIAGPHAEEFSTPDATAATENLIFVAPVNPAHHWTARLATSLSMGGLLLLCIATVIVATYRGSRDLDSPGAEVTPTSLAAFHGLSAPEKQLASQYVDSNGDLLADPPQADKLLNPDTLVVAHYEGDYDEEPPVNWEAFRVHLAKATGKKIELREYLQTADQVAAIARGEIHIVSPHAADIPYLVNSAGLVPFAMLGTDDAPNGNHMVIAVSRTSTINSLADLRGKTLACTQPNSITGYRAAISLLSQEADLRPDADYRVLYSSGQERSIRGLSDGLFEVAAISHDKLLLLRAAGRLDDSNYRTIFESNVVPRRTIGFVHNLDPILATKLRSVVLSFKNERAGGAEPEQLPMHFFPVEYRRDFEFVRTMDNSFDPRFTQVLAATRAR